MFKGERKNLPSSAYLFLFSLSLSLSLSLSFCHLDTVVVIMYYKIFNETTFKCKIVSNRKSIKFKDIFLNDVLLTNLINKSMF